MKKIISLFLLVALISLALCLAACKDDADVSDPSSGTVSGDGAAENESDNEPDEDEGPTYPAPELPNEDYTNQTFTVLVRNNGGGGCVDIYAEVDSGDTLKDAVYKRNSVIEDKYGISIQEVHATDTAVNNVLYNSVAANEKNFDMIDISFQQCYTAAMDGILLDLSTDLEYLDLSNPWWDHQTNEDFTIANKQFYAIGNANIDAVQGTWALVFNKAIMDDLGYEDGYLYDMVRNGEWTLDALYNVIKGYARDLNNDNAMTTDDQYGMSLNGASLYGFMINSGIDITRKDENDELYFVDFDDRTNDVLTKLGTVLSTKNSYNHNNTNQNLNDQSVNSDYVPFLEKRAIFFSQAFGAIEKFRDMDADYGVIPHPKYSEAEDYRSFIHWYIGCAFGVPITAPDLTKTAIMMEEMTYFATDMVLPVYFQRVLEGKYTRDAESYEMINEYIMPKRIYDCGFANHLGGFTDTIYNLFLVDANIFASTYKRSERNMHRVVEEINEAFR